VYKSLQRCANTDADITSAGTYIITVTGLPGLFLHWSTY